MNILLLNILLAIVGGFVMNFMPCILPLISLKISSFLGSYDNKRLYVIKNTSYIAGVISFFLALAIALSALKIAGKQIMFGSHMQSGFLLFLIFVILILIGYNLSGLFEITILSGATNKSSKIIDRFHGGQVLVNYFNGLLSSILAIPCTAPFIGTVFAYGMSSEGYIKIFLITISMGIGFALPFILALTVPKLVSKLMPRPGAWMDKFKQLMAFPILATAAWILFVLIKQGDLFYVALSLFFALFAYFAIWLINNINLNALYKSIIALSVLVGSYFMLPDMDSNISNNVELVNESIGFEYGKKIPFSKNALIKAVKNGENILIVASASWCLTCKVNETNALSSEDFSNLLREKKIVYLYIDLTKDNPEGQSFLNERNQVGIPYYILINKKGKEIIWPSLLKSGQVLESLRNL